MDKREPSLNEARDNARPTDAPSEGREGAAPAPEVRHNPAGPTAPPRAPATAPTPAAAPASRAKGPPADPAEFERWLGIEQLKVNMRRLEVESRRLELENRRAAGAVEPPGPTTAAPEVPARASAGRLLTIIVGILALVLGALAGISAQQTAAQRTEVAALRGEVTTLRSALASLENRVADAETRAAEMAAAPPAVPQPAPAAPVAPTPAPEQPLAGTPGEPLANAAAATAPAPDVPPAPEPPARPAQMGDGYTVRLFAPVKNLPAARIDAITNILKGAGFEVVVSDTGIAAPTSNTLSYHAASTDEANKLASLIQSKRPSLDIELRASPSIPAAARQVLILNLTEDALR
ncbi:hypothetical protein [Ancylobacter sp. SL191]|uniref:hypothetical protein n=1 Tax=Ancylobacter sp. SL191 TaxID=2995166 RepID=UPI002271C7A8|nr:hypothetical protein [Ancylobacter sp. SL191]WAC28672.1 hypothetical protein OU996_06385 [Ancylobacter sp. SL191]